MMSKKIAWLCVLVLGAVFLMVVLALVSQQGDLLAQASSSTPEASTDWQWESVDLPYVRANVLDGRQVQALAIDPQIPTTVYAGTARDGLYRTVDGGDTWVSLTLPVSSIGSLAIDTRRRQNVYAGTGGGVYRTEDAGENWELVSDGDESVYAIVISDQEPNLLFAGTTQGILKSTDYGQTWMTTTLTQQVWSMSIDNISGKVYAATFGWPPDASVEVDPETGLVSSDRPFIGQVYASQDQGLTWDVIFDGPARPVLVDSSTHTIYIGKETALLRSDDDGQTWTQLPNLLQSGSVLAISSSSEALYVGTSAGVFISRDGGLSWAEPQRLTAKRVIWSLVLDPLSPETLFAGSDKGILKTMDGGVSWFTANQGEAYQSLDAFTLSPNPDEPSTLLLGTDRGVYCSFDDGQTWHHAVGGPQSEIRTLVLNPQSHGRMWYGGGAAGIFRSDTGGESWLASGEGLANAGVYSLIIDPEVPATLYAGTDSGLFRTTDGGMHWMFVDSPLHNVYTLLLDVTHPTTVYAGTDDGLYCSIDSGETWEQIDAVASVYALAQDEVGAVYAATGEGLYRYARPMYDGERMRFGDTRALFLALDYPETIYLGMPNGIIVSVDEGQSWQDAGLPDISVRSLRGIPNPPTLYALTNKGVFRTILPEVPAGPEPPTEAPLDAPIIWNTLLTLSRQMEFAHQYFNVRSLLAFERRLYAGTEGGVFVSVDGGQTWQPAGEGLPDRPVNSLLAFERRLYAGTEGGVFVSVDGGQTWQLAGEGLSDQLVNSLLAFEGRLYAGTERGFRSGGGVFVSVDGGQTWQPAGEGLSDQPVNSLLAFEGRLYAGTWGGVFVSVNGGQTWQPAGEGLSDQSVSSLLAFEGRLYAGTYRSGVFVNADEGSSWLNSSGSALREEKETHLVHLEVLPANVITRDIACVSTQWSGVFCTLHGSHWYAANRGLDGLGSRTVRALVSDGKRVYGGTANGLFTSTTSEPLVWQRSSDELTRKSIQALALTSSSIYAVTGDTAVVKSEDGGMHWSISSTRLPATYIYRLLVTPDASRLYAATNAGVYRSTDDGQTWSVAPGDFADQDVWDLLIAWPLTDTLYAATSSALFKSENGGDTWQRLFSGDFRAVAVDPFSPQTIYAAADGQLLLSRDGGLSWEEIASPDGISIDLVAIGAGDPNTVWAGEKSAGRIVYGKINHALFAREILEQGHGQFGLGDYPAALDLYQRSLVMFTAAGDSAGQGEADYRLGMTYARLAQYEKAVSHYQAALTFYESQTDDVETMSWLHYELGRAYGALHDLQTAIEQYNQAIALVPEFGEAYRERGYTYRDLGERKAAQADLDRAVALGIENVELPPPPSRLPWMIGLGGLILVMMAGFFRLSHSSGLGPGLLLRQKLSLLEVGLRYRDYRQRWENGTPLVRLVTLLIPFGQAWDTQRIAQQLVELNIPLEIEQLDAELNAAVRERLVLRQQGNYGLAEASLARALQAHEGRAGQLALAEQIRRDHPLCINARRFMERVDFKLIPLEKPLVYRCQPSPDLQSLLPAVVYVWFVPGETLGGERIRNIQEHVEHQQGQTAAIFVITDRRPADEGWAQIGTLRMEGLTILPVENSLINAGLATGQERRLLRREIEKRLGADYDPYDVRDPVAGAFSFFGRDGLVEDLLHRITEGRSVGIFGMRKLGKSSLLQALRDRAAFPVAGVNLQTMGPLALDELFMRILRYWRQWARMRYGMDWELPPLTSDNFTSAFVTAALDLLDQIERTAGEARLGLFLDEVELIVPRLDGSGADLHRYLMFLRAVRGLVDEDGRLSLVVASLNPSINRINTWGGEQNPTFNLFQEIYLPPLAREDCIQMVRNIGRQVGLVYREESLEAIASLSGGHPFLARQLCSVLYGQRGRQPGQIEAADVPAGIERFIYDEQTVAHLDAGIWQDAGNLALWGEVHAQVNQALLLELARADGIVPQSDLLRAPDADLRRAALINLERFHFIHQPEPGFYALRYGLLRTWLRRRKLGLE